MLLIACRSTPPPTATRDRKATGIEAEILDELNALRTGPDRYAALLESRVKLYRGKILHLPGETPIRTKEGPQAMREAIAELRGMKPVRPLEQSDPLSRAAADHVRDVGPKGLVAHEGTDGSSPSQRVGRYTREMQMVGETISFGPQDAKTVIIDLIVDDGVPSRGHRKILLDDRFTVVGAACGPHTVYRYMCVLDFGRQW